MANYLTWTPLRFGKHEGKTLPQAVLSDPVYFFWAFDRGIFRDPQDSEAEEVAYRARHIKRPKPDPENWRVEYEFSLDNKFVDFSFIQAENANHQLSYTKIDKYLDLSLPPSMKFYDKTGGKLLIQKFKYYYLHNSNVTKRNCDDFFLHQSEFRLAD